MTLKWNLTSKNGTDIGILELNWDLNRLDIGIRLNNSWNAEILS